MLLLQPSSRGFRPQLFEATDQPTAKVTTEWSNINNTNIIGDGPLWRASNRSWKLTDVNSLCQNLNWWSNGHAFYKRERELIRMKWTVQESASPARPPGNVSVRFTCLRPVTVGFLKMDWDTGFMFSSKNIAWKRRNRSLQWRLLGLSTRWCLINIYVRDTFKYNK